MMKKRTHFTRCSVVLLALVFGLVLEVFHYALVPHHYCHAQGEWTHQDEITREKSQKELNTLNEPSLLGVGYTLPNSQPQDGDHSGCLVFVLQQNWKKSPVSVVLLPSLPRQTVALTPRVARATFVTSLSPLSRAPKNSPPSA